MDLVPTNEQSASEEELVSEEEPTPKHKMKTLKLVSLEQQIHQFFTTWCGYTTAGQAAVHDDIFIMLFISEYLAVIEAEKPAIYPVMTWHLQESMGDSELYGWEPVRAFHAIWLQQLEHGSHLG